MKEINGKKYAESLDEYFAQFDTPEEKAKKEAASKAHEPIVDYASRLGLSDEEYAALTKPIRVY